MHRRAVVDEAGLAVGREQQRPVEIDEGGAGGDDKDSDSGVVDAEFEEVDDKK